jgi:hypothetical protein
MILFSNGCSFLTPRPKDNVNTFVTKELSESYNLDLVNLAMGGRGNTRVEFSTKVWVEQNENEKIFAVIGWSNSHRHDYVTDDGWKAGRIPGTELTWRTWKTLDNLNFISKQKGWDVENNADMNFFNNVYNLQNYFKIKNIPYVMYNALPNNFETDVLDFQILKQKINMERFFQPDTSHYEFVMEKNFIVSAEDPHPSVEGHITWANMLKDFIDVNNLRSIK